MAMKFKKKFLIHSIKAMINICFSMLKIIMVKCGERYGSRGEIWVFALEIHNNFHIPHNFYLKIDNENATVY